MKRFVIASLGATLLLVALLAMLRERPPSDSGTALNVFCSQSWSAPVTTAARQFERDTGIEVSLGVVDEALKERAGLILADRHQLEKDREGGAIREIIPVAKSGTSVMAAAVPTGCERPSAALRFARYLAAPEKGGPIFEAAGMAPVPGDSWAEVPKLSFFSGGVNRPAVEKVVREFADREGVTVTTVFNGCGILCATMQTMADADDPDKLPDAYYACDLCFVPPVAEFFPEAVLLTETDIGIAVHLGNPSNVRSLADLARPGLRVGLCNALQSTLGYMTRGMLRSSGLLESVTRNVSVEVPTADFLINQLRAGGLDAAVVYRVNAQVAAKDLEFIPIQHAGARAVQPFAVRAESPRKQLALRLLEFLKSHRESFEDAGFLWRGEDQPIQSREIEIPEWLKESP